MLAERAQPQPQPAPLLGRSTAQQKKKKKNHFLFLLKSDLTKLAKPLTWTLLNCVRIV